MVVVIEYHLIYSNGIVVWPTNIVPGEDCSTVLPTVCGVPPAAATVNEPNVFFVANASVRGTRHASTEVDG